MNRPLLLKPLRIGLTGGIASGKSAVAAEFAKLGIPIIDADVLAREVVQPGQPAFQDLVRHFGGDILDSQGRLDRPRMRQRIFADPLAKQTLENTLHPAIRARQEQLASQLGGPYQIHVMPLLVETGSQHYYDRILVVDCERATQLQRLLTRDGISAELAERMLTAQADRATRLAAADDVLDNQLPLAALPEKVAQLHQRYLEFAQHRADAKK